MLLQVADFLGKKLRYYDSSGRTSPTDLLDAWVQLSSVGPHLQKVLEQLKIFIIFLLLFQDISMQTKDVDSVRVPLCGAGGDMRAPNRLLTCFIVCFSCSKDLFGSPSTRREVGRAPTINLQGGHLITPRCTKFFGGLYILFCLAFTGTVCACEVF